MQGLLIRTQFKFIITCYFQASIETSYYPSYFEILITLIRYF